MTHATPTHPSHLHVKLARNTIFFHVAPEGGLADAELGGGEFAVALVVFQGLSDGDQDHALAKTLELDDVAFPAVVEGGFARPGSKDMENWLRCPL